jgi:hypothetical protein
MDHKKAVIFLVSFLILGWIYTNLGFGMPIQFRSILGFLFLIAFVVCAVIYIYQPISGNSALKKHFLIRFGILLLIILVGGITYSSLIQQNDRLGAGYMAYFMALGIGIPATIFMVIETFLLFMRKKNDQVILNLLLAELIFCIVVFSGLFGY